MGIDARFLHSAFLYFETQGWLRAHSMYMLTWTHMAWARDGGSLIRVRHIAKFKGLLTKG